jgi:hypothetical protein
LTDFRQLSECTTKVCGNAAAMAAVMAALTVAEGAVDVD